LKTANLLLNGTITVACLIFFYQTFHFPMLFGIEDSGPALFPRIALAALLLFVIIDSAVIIRKRDGEFFFTKEERGNLWRLALLIGLLVFFVFFLGKLPFLILSLVTMFLIGLVFQLKWGPALLTAVVLTFFIQFVFIKGLNIIL
jgi:hypothetical protein